MGKVHIDLNNKTILVTGSPGFIGANLVLRLLNELSGGTVITNTYDTLGRRASGDPPGREPKTGPERQKVRRLPSVRSDLPESCHHIRQKENSKEGMNPFRQKDR